MYNTYTLNEGDTLDNIALKFNISKELLKSINSDVTSFNKGDKIFIPKIVSNYFDYYSVIDGDTLYNIANNNNINPSLLAQLNGINESDYIYPNQVLLIPKAGSILYITAAGDTLQEIAKGINADMDELLVENQKIYLQPEQLIVYKYK